MDRKLNMDTNYALTQTKYTTINHNEHRYFTLETQMGKLASNGCSTFILTIFDYNVAHGFGASSPLSEKKKIPLRD